MSDGAVMSYCELCGGGIDVDDVPEGWDGTIARQLCDMCLHICALPLTPTQRGQVLAWVHDAPVAQHKEG